MAKEESKLPVKGENKPVKKAAKKGFFAKVGALPKKFWGAIVNTWHELKKVTWPGRKELINATGVVLVFLVAMAVLVGLLDLGASELISLIIR